MTDPILYETDGPIAIIRLNRPERRNAINESLLRGLYDSLESATNDSAVKVIIITGEGKAFCSGLDLDCLATDNLLDPRGDGRDMVDLINACEKPIIGAVNGYAITGGFELALNCDFLIAAQSAAFADTHARVGIQPGWGMTQLLQQAVGQRMAKQMSLTCRFISAEQALHYGLVNEVVPDDQLMPRVMEIAAAICDVNYEMALTVKRLIEYRNQAFLNDSMNHERENLKAMMAAMKK